MKNAFFIVLFLFFWGNIFSQEIKQIKITELQNYITGSDHPLIVNFWATYCQPCINEIPYLEKLALEQKEKKLELLFISVDLPNCYPQKLKDFVKEKNIVSTVYWLSDGNPQDFCPQFDKKWTGGIPASLFINNKTHFRKFFDRQVTDRQVAQNIKAMMKD